MFQIKVVEKNKTHILCAVYEVVLKKCGRARHATDDCNTVHALCMLDN
jgi:hypothetical protein